MASRAAQSRLSSGPPSSPSFAASTRATAAKSRANASTPRRVVTNPSPRPPSSLQNRDDASSSAADSDDAALAHITETTKPSKKVETLYSHPNVKIITFSATARTAPRNPASPHSPKEVLTWSSHLERTIAMGPFKIYRAPGSVAFLNCGSALQPILSKSQCWCLDEEGSRFVLQIRRPQYWRIELPLDSSDDCHRAEILRDVLSGILMFEKTVCPFERSFTPTIPEPSETPPPRPSTRPRRPSWQSGEPSSFVSPLGPYDQSPDSWHRRSSASSTQSLYERPRSSISERPTTSQSESSFSGVSEAESDYMDDSYMATPKANPPHVAVNSDIKPLGTNLEERISAESRRQEWIRKQYVHSMQDTVNKGPAYLDDLEEYDDDVSDVGSVVSDLTHVRTMTSRSLYSRQRETAVFEAEDATSRPGRNISRDVRRTGNEIHEGSGMGGNSVLKKRLRRSGFQASHLNLTSSCGSKVIESRPQSPLSMTPRANPPLTMAPRPPNMKPRTRLPMPASYSSSTTASRTSSRSTSSTLTARSDNTRSRAPSPPATHDSIRSVTVEWDRKKSGNMPPSPPESQTDSPPLSQAAEPVARLSGLPKSIDPSKSMKLSKPTDATKTSKLARPAELAKPIEMAKTTKTAKSAESSRPSKLAKPADKAKSPEQAKGSESPRKTMSPKVTEKSKVAEKSKASEKAKAADKAKVAEKTKVADKPKAVEKLKATEDVKPSLAVQVAETKPEPKIAVPEPVTPVEAKPIEDIKPAEEVKPVEEVKVVEDIKPVEEAKPTEGAKPTEKIEAVEEVKVVEEVEIAQDTKMAGGPEPIEEVKPVEPEVKSVAAEPTEEIKLVENLQPVKTLVSEPEPKPATEEPEPKAPIEESEPKATAEEQKQEYIIDERTSIPTPQDPQNMEEKEEKAKPIVEAPALKASPEIVSQAKAAPVEAAKATVTAPEPIDTTPKPRAISRAPTRSHSPEPKSPVSPSTQQVFSPSQFRKRPSHRATTSISHRRALSPVPSAANLFSPPRQRRHGRPGHGHRHNPSQVDNIRNIPWSIVAKTCDLLLGPPSNLMKLMLQVAAKIMAGQWRGVVYGQDENGAEIPVHWDYTDPEESMFDRGLSAEQRAAFDGVDENGDDYYARGRRLASGRLTPDIDELD